MTFDPETTQPIPRHRPAPGNGHGHGHGHGPAAPASARVRRLLAYVLIPIAALTVLGMLALYPFGAPHQTAQALSGTSVHGDVTATATASCADNPGAPKTPSGAGNCVAVTVRLTTGPAPGTSVTMRQPVEPGSPVFTVGDKVVLDYSGANPARPESYQLTDFQRGNSLLVLFLLFVGAVLLLARWQGLASLGALAISLGVILFFVLPAILAGENPLAVAVVGAGVIMFVVLYLTHGLTARTSTAVLGTLVSLALIGLLGAGFSAAAHLTGLDEDTSMLINVLGHGIDSRGLLLAGMVIGALGVLDDVTVTQTSAVWELRRANPAYTTRELYASALRIGRDHISSAVNTLVMAYAGAALPLLLAYSLSGRGFGEIVSTQVVAQEVVRTLVGSIGLVAAVPVTSMLAALVARREELSAAPGV